MKRSVRILLFVLLTALVAFAFSGCVDIGGNTKPDVTAPPMTAAYYEDYDAAYAHYNQVAFTDTLETLTARFGEPEVLETENGNNYTWVLEDGYGFTAAFYETGELRVKVVHYEDIRQFSKLSNSTNLSTVESFDKDVDFQTCVAVFAGRPIEIAQIANSSDGSDIKRVYTWLDQNDNIVQILFKADGKVESISYNVQ